MTPRIFSRTACRDDLEVFISRLTIDMVETYGKCRHMADMRGLALPERSAVVSIINSLANILYPGFYSREGLEDGKIKPFYISVVLDQLLHQLTEQISCALCHDSGRLTDETEGIAFGKAKSFLKQLPKLALLLEEDVKAAYDGDPAAKSYQEIVFCYPGVEAVTIYRMAHELVLLDVPMVPRMMTEYAHTRTGVDIHPGATIGRGFFIDHGTGVVIGETCFIGNSVKLYQGVTLGALSFPKDDHGQIVRGKKRHPTLEDNVVVYANATILGGDTIIGKDSIVGSNVWLTQTVPPSTLVTLEKPSLRFKGPGDSFIPPVPTQKK